MTAPNEYILLLLRVISGSLLLALLAAIFRILWQESQRLVVEVEARRRRYGTLVMLRSIDGQYMVTGETFPLLPLTSLGRAPTNTITINDTFASSNHAQVTLRNGQWWLEDRNSRNGTLLNERIVTQPTVITQGDVIGIGEIRLKLELEV
ncbi:MAG: FHA domain-containing protein [Anaerolineae bacterium]